MDEEGYRRELAALREENEYLRAAARTFGELAERLATEMRKARPKAESCAGRTTRSARRAARAD